MRPLTTHPPRVDRKTLTLGHPEVHPGFLPQAERIGCQEDLLTDVPQRARL